jgi:hypothetical protein
MTMTSPAASHGSRQKILLGAVAAIIILLGLTQLSMWLHRGMQTAKLTGRARQEVADVTSQLAALDNDTVKLYAPVELRIAQDDLWFVLGIVKSNKPAYALQWLPRVRDDIAIVKQRTQQCRDSISQRRTAVLNKKQ